MTERLQILGKGAPCDRCGEETERGWWDGREIIIHRRGYCPGRA